MENVALRRTSAVETYDYSVASRALAGEQQSGDAALVLAEGGKILVAVVDGLGHGAEAAQAAQAAISTLRTHAGQSMAGLFQRCDEALRSTRGAAMALATLEATSATLSWSGVGNVEGVLIGTGHRQSRRRRYLTNRCGVVGYRMPAVQVCELPLHPGDTLILATDGIDERFAAGDIPAGAPDRLARAILDRHDKRSDDALVLVLRWLGPAAGTLHGERS